MMNRLDFLKNMGLATTGLILSRNITFSQTGSNRNSRPNILWITCEDISPNLGCYGDDFATTPNLDSLARQGERFTNAFAVAGVCAPSRSAIITGMYPTTIGSHHMRTAMGQVAKVLRILEQGHWPSGQDFPPPPTKAAVNELYRALGPTNKGYQTVPPPEVKCFTEYLRAAGYYCTNDVKADYQFAAPVTAWDLRAKGVRWRGRAKNQPFFSVINLTTTHEGQLRVNYDKVKLQHDPTKVPLPPYYPDTLIVRKNCARYYDVVTMMDKQVGRILADLENDGLADNTIVFFFSDHGSGLTRHKYWIYDSGIHVPLIIRWPGKLKPATVDDRLVSLMDLGPTLLSITGIPIPSHMQGKAFLGRQCAPPREYIFAARDRIDEVYDHIRCVRDKRYKYIRNYQSEKPYAQPFWDMDRMPIMRQMRRLNAMGRLTGPQQLFFNNKPREELYDIVADPHEIHNLADSSSHQHILKRLRSTHKQWIEETHDLGFVPEYKLRERMWPGGKQPETKQPIVSPTGGVFKNQVAIQITCPTAGASIAYSTEEGPPVRWQLYAQPLQITQSMTLTVRACRLGFRDSHVVKAHFHIV